MTPVQAENHADDAELAAAVARKALGTGDTSLVDFEVSDILDTLLIGKEREPGICIE
jgi:hypothetical protein